MDVGCAIRRKPMSGWLLAAAVVLAACSTPEEQSAPSTATERTTVATTAVATTTAPTTTIPASPTMAPATNASPEMTVEFTIDMELALHYPSPTTEPTAASPTIAPGICANTDCFVPLTVSGYWQVASGAFSGPVTHVGYAVGHGGTFEAIQLLWFEGTVSGCGDGGVAIREASRHQPDGTASIGWEVVPGLGVGDLATLTGHGTANGFPGGDHTGTIQCQGDADTTVFSSTLLGPPSSSGTDVAVPAHVPTSITDYPIEPHPAQTDTPDMWVSVADYDRWTSTMLNLGARFPETSTTPVRNTMVSIFAAEDSSVLFPDLDCPPSHVFGRVFLDDVLYPEYRGAWDLLSYGVQGGGTYNATTNEGRVRCA
jgi:hypothetical protein